MLQVPKWQQWGTKAAGPQAGSHVAGERPRWIGTPCRVRLHIYLVGYGRERGKGEMGEEQIEMRAWGSHAIIYLFGRETEKEEAQTGAEARSACLGSGEGEWAEFVS